MKDWTRAERRQFAELLTRFVGAYRERNTPNRKSRRAKRTIK
jgi:hypothetical protein